MRTPARVLLYLGTASAVAGLGAVHANRHGYDYVSSSRFLWSSAYAAFLCLAAFASGLPDLARDPRSRLTTAVTAPAAAALGISAVTLFSGDALLPRFGVFGTASILATSYVLSAPVASAGRTLPTG